MHIRRMRQWLDERGEQYDEDYFTYSFVPGATSDNGVSVALAPGASAIAQLQIEQDSAFIWQYASAAVTLSGADTQIDANITVQITDSASGRNLFSAPVPMPIISGSGYFPFVLPFPRRFMPKTTITIVFTNFDTATTYKLIQFNMIGRKIFMRDGGRPLNRFKVLPEMSLEVSEREGRNVVLAEDFFGYVFNWGAINFGTNAQSKVLIESDSDFEARTASAAAFQTLAGGQPTDAANGIMVKIKDGGSQRELSNVPISTFDYAGAAIGNLAGLPLVLPVPRIFLAQTSVIMTAYNNYTAQNIAQFNWVFTGRKIFELEP